VRSTEESLCASSNPGTGPQRRSRNGSLAPLGMTFVCHSEVRSTEESLTASFNPYIEPQIRSSEIRWEGD
jgi:hypothetical protein